ncbi:MAG: hypothetical protein QNK37_21500 [Acidobacteriota bacterium]|nr:hypothetical protein [Acidobacteriota bacterium]
MPYIFFNAQPGSELELATNPPSGDFSVQAVPIISGVEGPRWVLPHTESLQAGKEYTITVFLVGGGGQNIEYSAIVRNPDGSTDPAVGPYIDQISEDPTDRLHIPVVS